MKRKLPNNDNKTQDENGNSSNTSSNSAETLTDEGAEENQLNGKKDENGGPSRKKKRTSPMWNHFNVKFCNEEKADFAHCKYCEKNFRLGGKSNKSTGNLIRHMHSDHSNIYPPVNPGPSQGRFEFSQERYRQALLTWIVNSDQPFCSCQQEDFVNLLKTLNPEAASYSSQTIKRDIMKKFKESVANIKLRLAKVSSKIAFTIDAWTSKNVLPFMNIRAHWINDDWTYESVMVDFSFIEGKHDGQNFSQLFLDCLKRFEIPLSKVSALTMDNATSNDTFIEFLEKHGIKIGTRFTSSQNRIRCLPHVLNLAVQDTLASLKIPLNHKPDLYGYLDEDCENTAECNELEGENGEKDNEVEEEEDDDDDDDLQDEEPTIKTNTNPTIPKLRKLVKKIRKSPQMREKLKNVCLLFKMEYLVPVIDVATRWDSTFDMLERAKYLKDALDVMCSKEKKLKKFLLTDEEWTELNSLRFLLKKFGRSTKHMSMERHPTINAYLPTFNYIIESVESFICENPGALGEAAKVGLDKLKKYQNEFQLTKCNIPYIATFLNPALKLHYFKEHGYTKAKIRDIQKAICEVFENNYESETIDDGENVEEPLDDLLTHMYKRSNANREPKEFQKYLNAPLSNPRVDLLEFWRSQKEEYPNLYRMAQDYLAIQGSSVAVERDFSMGTHLVTSTRCSLRPESIRACMCLKSWFKKPKKPKSDQSGTERIHFADSIAKSAKSANSLN